MPEPTAVTEDFTATPIPPRSPLPFTGVPKRKRSLFYTQLARMLQAGLSPVKSLRTLAIQSGGGRLARAAARMATHIESGGTLGSAFAHEPNLFPPSEVRMVEASERGGETPATMLRIARFLDKLVAAQRKVVTGMIYPGLCLFIVFVGIPNALAYFGVIPPVWHLYQIAAFLLFAGGCAWVTVWRSLNALGAVRYMIHAVLNPLPVVGGMLRRLAWVRFAHGFECLYSAGMLPHQALVHAASACGNAVIGDRLARAAPQVEAGGSLTAALTASRALPQIGLELIAVGEESGKLEPSLRKFAEYEEGDLTTAIERSAKVLVVLVTLGYVLLMAFLILMVAASYGRVLNSFMPR